LNARTPLGFRRTRTLNLLGVVPSAVVAWHFYMARDAALGLRRAAANVATRTMISPWRVVDPPLVAVSAAVFHALLNGATD
jgi:hypothetical protein